MLIVFGVGSAQEPQSNRYGLKIPTQEFLDSLPKEKFIPARPRFIGKSIDLTGWMPSPRDQRSQGSCVAWTLGYGLKTYQERLEERDNSIVLSPAFVFNSIKGMAGRCDEGVLFAKALNFLKNKGICTWNDMPYDATDCNTQPSYHAKRNAERYVIEDWKTIYASENHPISDIYPVKYELYNGNPVGVAVWLDSKIVRFMNDMSSGKPKFVWKNPLKDTSKKYFYHALLCVGYDDDKEEFKLLNSYGPDSGNNGYLYISYDAFKEAVYEAYYAVDSDNYGRYVTATRLRSYNKEFGIAESTINFYGWLKKGYFIQVNDELKVSCSYLKKSGDLVILRLYDTSGEKNKLIGSYKFNSGDAYEITYNGNVYSLKLDKIAGAGLNIFKQAAFIEFSSI